MFLESFRLRVHDPDLPRAVSDPKLRVVVGAGQHAVRTGEVVSLSRIKARESRVGELRDSSRVLRRIDHVDRFVVAICQEELVELWIEPADVKRKERGRARHLHDGRDLEHFVFLEVVARSFGLAQGRHCDSQHGNGADPHSGH